MVRIRTVGLTMVLALTARPGAAQQNPKDAVLGVGQAVFDAMARKDTAALRRLVHPAAHFIAAVEIADSTAPRVTGMEQFLTQIATYPGVPLERMWNAEVRVSGPVATIWTQYDFHKAGQFSHCGIDAFQLVRNGRQWQVTSILYTLVPAPERCKNPIGPPR